MSVDVRSLVATIFEDVVRRGGEEGLELPLAAVDRLQYVFLG